jgi:hypothetical protein
MAAHTADSCHFREPIGFSAFQAKTRKYDYVIPGGPFQPVFNVYKLSARVVRLAIESEQIESADFAFEESILIREASTEEVTYLLEHPSKDETNENQQVATVVI